MKDRKRKWWKECGGEISTIKTPIPIIGIYLIS